MFYHSQHTATSDIYFQKKKIVRTFLTFYHGEIAISILNITEIVQSIIVVAVITSQVSVDPQNGIKSVFCSN